MNKQSEPRRQAANKSEKQAPKGNPQAAHSKNAPHDEADDDKKPTNTGYEGELGGKERLGQI